MSLVHPWAMVAGAALAGLPVAIHFLTRPRPAAHPLSTLRFVSELLKQRAARTGQDPETIALEALQEKLLGADEPENEANSLADRRARFRAFVQSAPRGNPAASCVASTSWESSPCGNERPWGGRAFRERGRVAKP